MNVQERNEHRVAVYAFKKELRNLLHKHNMDVATGVPDQVLTDFLMNQIVALGKVQDTIELWKNIRR